jgi:hypothetical protein
MLEDPALMTRIGSVIAATQALHPGLFRASDALEEEAEQLNKTLGRLGATSS